MSDYLGKAVNFRKTLAYIIKKLFWEDKMSAWLIYLAFLINIIGWLLLRWEISPAQSEVILHYNVFLGIDAISFDLQNYYFQIFYAPLGGLAIWVLNIIFSGLIIFPEQIESIQQKNLDEAESCNCFLDANSLGSYILLTIGFVVQLAILVYVTGIIFVNR